MEKIKEKGAGYSSRFGMLCVLIGGSVGTGNMWRFPRLVANCGGGSFIIVMTICLFLIAIPLVYVENVIGRATRHSAPGAFRDMIGEKWTWMGTVATLIYFLMLSYYCVVLGWCSRYTVMSITGSYFGADKAELFTQVTNGDPITAVCWLVGMVLIYLCIKKRTGLEKSSSILLPALFVILVVLAVYALTRENASSGLEYAFTVDAAALVKPNTWIEALAQCAWSVGPGTMMIVAGAKYQSKDDDIVLNSHTLAFGDMTVALLATLVVLPCVFAFAASTDSAVEICQSGSNGITFLGLTNLFEVMPAGRLVGTLFFLCLTFAAFSSATLMATCFSNALIDLGMTRTKAVRIVVVALTIAGIPSVLNQDFLTNQDTTWGTGLVFGTLFLGFLVRKFGAAKMRNQLINPVSDIKITKRWDFLAGTLAPFAIAVLLITWIVQSIGWSDNWWNPFEVANLGTMVCQWAVVFIAAFAMNKWINKAIKKKYFNGETFDDIPEEILNEQ